MTRDVIRRHYENLEREHAEICPLEAERTRIEGQNMLRIADLDYLVRWSNAPRCH